MQRFDTHGTPAHQPPERPGGFNPRSALLAFAFATFVLGGFVFGWLAINNWRLLSTFQAARLPTIGGPSIVVPQSPDINRTPRGPGDRPILVPPVPGAPAPAEVADPQQDIET